MKIKLGFICAATALIVVLLITNHRYQVRLREEDPSSQLQVEPRVSADEGNSNLQAGLQRPDFVRQAQVQQNQTQPAQPAAVPTAGWVGNVLPKETCSFAGYDDPRAALETAFWALENGNLPGYLASLTPKEKGRFELNLQKTGQTGPDFVAAAAAEFQQVNQLALLYKQVVSDDEVILNVYAQGGDRGQQKARFTRVANEWKFDGWVEH